MLEHHQPALHRRLARRMRHGAQQGVVLIIALIVLVAMTLAALALVRSVDTNNLIAGNLSFQQAATHSADTGIEAAITWLTTNNIGTFLENDQAGAGYAANGNTIGPDLTQNPPQSWDAFWNATLAARAITLAPDAAGNTPSYVIDRLCNSAGSATGGAGCVASPAVAVSAGNSEEAGEKQLNAPSSVYYRITVRVAGPRNTVSYVQSVISM